MMESEFRTASPAFTLWSGASWLFLWMLVSASGLGIAYPLLLLISVVVVDAQLLELAGAIVLIAAPVAGAVAGAVIGVGQWLALRRRFPGTGSWVPRSMLAWAAGFFVTTALFFGLARDGLNYTTLIVPFVGGGAAAGAFHVPLIRRWVRNEVWWVLAMSSGWVVGWVAGWAFLAQFLRSPGIPESGLILLLGAMHGTFIGFQSGLTLIYLLIFVPEVKTREDQPTL